MLIIKSHDDQTGTICTLEIPGDELKIAKVSQELKNGKYPSNIAFSHRGANLEVNFQKTEEFANFATWIFGEIGNLSKN